MSIVELIIDFIMDAVQSVPPWMFWLAGAPLALFVVILILKR